MTTPTLFDLVMRHWLYEQRKHDKGDHYAESRVNALSNYELLEVISEALEEMKVTPT